MTLLGEIFPARTAACLTIVSTSVEVSWANAGETKLSAAKIRSARSFIGTVLIRCIIDCRSCSLGRPLCWLANPRQLRASSPSHALVNLGIHRREQTSADRVARIFLGRHWP